MSRLPAPTVAAYAAARRSRDARFDGRFFIGVTSTGIYCRPVCPAPTAHERNVRYFEHAASAAAAGFRPCLRCRPELAPGAAPCDSGDRLFDLALRRVGDGALAESSLAALAASLGVTDRHLRRLFVQRLGVAPLQVHLNRCVLLAKQLLSETRLPITDVALASGFASLRRFNQAFRDATGMNPSTLRRRHAEAAPGERLQLRLGYRPPYDFAAVLDFLRARCIAGVERIGSDHYERVLGPAERPGWLRISDEPARHALRLELALPDLRQLPALLRRLRRQFDLDADPLAVAAVLGADPRLAPALQRWPGQRVPGAFDGWEAAVRAVLGQQVSVAAATTLMRRVVERFGTPLDGVAGFERLFPTAAALRRGDLGGIGLTQARIDCLRHLAAAVDDGRLPLEQVDLPLADWLARALALPGIGPWTAQYMALRVLHHPDAFPAGDLILRKRLGGERPASEREAEQRSAAWRPWRAYAVMLLWRDAGTPEHGVSP
jgi:AraC family transcriptional regulator, regulatory protein of adaptative response / DNA-3-methyladenine glycosylase II